MPGPVKIHADLFGPVRCLAAVRGDFESLGDTVQKCLTVEAVEVTDDAVVGQNLHLVVGKDDGQEKVIGFLTGVIRVGFFPLDLDAGCGRGTVVAVGDVKAVEGCELLLDPGDEIGIGDDMEDVANAVVRREVIFGLFFQDIGDEGVDVLRRPVGQKDRPGLSVQGFDVPHPVVFLVRPGELVFLDEAVEVVPAGGCGHETCLDMVAPDLLVDVKAFLGVGRDDARQQEAFIILLALGVHGIGIKIRSRRQVDFRLPDVEKGIGVVFRHLAGFVRTQDVVGGRGH